MTSEIAVMNQRAVALAADSAVTLIDGGRVVVRNEHRKLFNLVAGQPVGVMFYGGAEVMGHPWEQLISHYQRKLKPGAMAHIEDYAASFTGMFDHLEEFFPKERHEDEFKRLIVSVYRYIFSYAQYLIGSMGGQGDERALLAAVIEEIWRGYQFDGQGGPRANLPCFPEGFAQTIAAQHGKDIEEVIAYAFGAYGLSAQAQQQLREIAVFAVVKDLFLEDVSGLVFAGFGEDDRYPTIVTYYASAIVGGIMKRSQKSIDSIDGDVHSQILLFADSGAASAFIRGIDPGLEQHMYDGAALFLKAIADETVDAFASSDPVQREGVRQAVQQDMLPRYFAYFYRGIARYQHQMFINPILRVLEVAGRKELAQTAAELVNLNIFKKRALAEKETVGGEVISAVISRESGFQWVNKAGGE